MSTVRQILGADPPSPISVAPGSSVFAALEVMAERNIGAVLVMEGTTMLGILSERDYARKVILKGRASSDTQVKDIMSSKVITVGLDNSTEDCMNLMTDKRIRHLPVVDGDTVVGVVSIGDIVKQLIADQKRTIEDLENFIRS